MRRSSSISIAPRTVNIIDSVLFLLARIWLILTIGGKWNSNRDSARSIWFHLIWWFSFSLIYAKFAGCRIILFSIHDPHLPSKIDQEKVIPRIERWIMVYCTFWFSANRINSQVKLLVRIDNCHRFMRIHKWMLVSGYYKWNVHYKIVYKKPRPSKINLAIVLIAQICHSNLPRYISRCCCDRVSGVHGKSEPLVWDSSSKPFPNVLFWDKKWAWESEKKKEMV